MPMTFLKEVFNVPQSALAASNSAAASAPRTVLQAIQVVVHANGVRQPGTLSAAVRVASASNAYLATTAGRCHHHWCVA